MTKTIDFDQFRKERKKEGITIKAFGEDIELLPSPPLSSVLNIIEMQEEGGVEELPAKQVKKSLQAMIGEEQFDNLIEKGMTVEESEWLITELWNKYNGKDDEQDDTKNAQNSPSQKNGDS